MSTFMNEDFLLTNDVAKKLFNDYAKNQPIIDYHCHIEAKEIAENKQRNEKRTDNLPQRKAGIAKRLKLL